MTKDLEGDAPEIKAMLVFTNDEAQIDVEDAPITALPLKKLKDFMRQRAREKPISVRDLEKMKNLLPQEE